MRRRGMSLLEVIIATGIFAGMVVLLMESMLNMRNLAATVTDVDILEEQAVNAKRAIVRDLANSGWFYCRPGANGRKFYPQIHLANKQAWQRYEIIPPPWVNVPVFNKVTLTTVPTDYVASVGAGPDIDTSNDNRSTLFGDAFFFTRLQPEGQPLTDTPAVRSATVVNFSQQGPLPLDQFAHARAVQSLVIDTDATDQTELTSVLWETTPGRAQSANGGTGLKAIDLFSDDNVRLFAYRVIPDPQTGRGNLVRFYSNPGEDRDSQAGWHEDGVLATDVVRMRVYSFEMSSWNDDSSGQRDFTVNPAAGLTNNQLRFVIQFARNLVQKDAATSIEADRQRLETTLTDDTSRASTVKILQFTVSLRSITNSIDE